MVVDTLVVQHSSIMCGGYIDPRTCHVQESRGAHAREDYPTRDDEHWMKHTIAWFDHSKGKDDRVKIDYRPVHDQPMDNEMEHVPPKPRVY